MIASVQLCSNVRFSILKAEQVTIQRLIQAHENGAGQQAPLGSAPLTAGSDSSRVDPATRARDMLLGIVIEPLPELQLDLAGEGSSALAGLGHRSGDEEEEEMDED